MTSIMHHPALESLMSCSAGSMPEAFAAVMASHLLACPQCRKELALMQDIGTEIFCAIRPSAMTREAPVMLARRAEAEPEPDEAETPAASPAGDVPRPLTPFAGRDLDKVAWQWIAPGVRQFRIPLSAGAKGDLRLIKIAPGKMLPEHGHEGSELTLVLRGSYSDATGQYAAGDVADLSTDVEHQPVADAGEGCVCLIASDRKIRFKTLMARLLQPLTGF